MKSLLLLAILTVFLALRCSDKTGDTELIRCLEKKILSGEIHQVEGNYLFSNKYMWADDSTIVINITMNWYNHATYNEKAHLTCLGEEIELSEHESDRIIEITNKESDKLYKNKQDSLRLKLTKICK